MDEQICLFVSVFAEMGEPEAKAFALTLLSIDDMANHVHVMDYLS